MAIADDNQTPPSNPLTPVNANAQAAGPPPPPPDVYTWDQRSPSHEPGDLIVPMNGGGNPITQSNDPSQLASAAAAALSPPSVDVGGFTPAPAEPPLPGTFTPDPGTGNWLPVDPTAPQEVKPNSPGATPGGIYTNEPVSIPVTVAESNDVEPAVPQDWTAPPDQLDRQDAYWNSKGRTSPVDPVPESQPPDVQDKSEALVNSGVSPGVIGEVETTLPAVPDLTPQQTPATGVTDPTVLTQSLPRTTSTDISPVSGLMADSNTGTDPSGTGLQQ